jgi:hypothetical protein
MVNYQVDSMEVGGMMDHYYHRYCLMELDVKMELGVVVIAAMIFWVILSFVKY